MNARPMKISPVCANLSTECASSTSTEAADAVIHYVVSRVPAISPATLTDASKCSRPIFRPQGDARGATFLQTLGRWREYSGALGRVSAYNQQAGMWINVTATAGGFTAMHGRTYTRQESTDERGGSQVLLEEGSRLFLLGGMQRTDTLDLLAHGGRFGGIGEALRNVPLGEGGQTLLQRADGVLVRVLGEVAHDAIARRGEKTTPSHFEMFHRRTVAAPGIFPGAGLQVEIRLIHLVLTAKRTFSHAGKSEKQLYDAITLHYLII